MLAADQLKAKGLVASIREVVNQKDAFTRMNNAREEERQARLAESKRIAAENRERSSRIENAKQGLYALFGTAATAQERGKLLETALNNLFQPTAFSSIKPSTWLVRLAQGLSSRLMGSLNSAVFCTSWK